MKFVAEMYKCKACERHREGTPNFVVEDAEGNYMGWICDECASLYSENYIGIDFTIKRRET